MKKSFTMVELIVVIVILGILSTIAIGILLKMSENYVINRETDKLLFESDLVLNELSNILRSRVKNSVIATECNLSLDECKRGIIRNFKSLSSVSKDESYKYPVMEWLSRSIYAKRGEWNSTLKRVVPGYAGFVDLKASEKNSNDDYNISIPYSHVDIIKDIEESYYKSWGVSFSDIFNDKLSVVVFSGPDGRGAFNDINHSYGWYKNRYPDNKAQKVFGVVQEINNSFLRVKTIDDDENATIYEGFFIVDTAMAIVPEKNREGDFNLTLIRNYFPWKNQDFTDGNKTLLISHVTQFKFREDGGVLRLFICIESPEVKIKDYNLTICKERIVF